MDVLTAGRSLLWTAIGLHGRVYAGGHKSNELKLPASDLRSQSASTVHAKPNTTHPTRSIT
eukprot:920875-Amphidinium_carterae.1